MQMIVTPRVRAEVQAHFKCPELEGAELEDQGEDGTALTHWEKRVFEVRNVKSSSPHVQRNDTNTVSSFRDIKWNKDSGFIF